MDVIMLETQLDPFFLNHLANFDFLNFISSLWTWVAVLAAAALSLWKIKSTVVVVVVVDSGSNNSQSSATTNKSDGGYVLLHQQQLQPAHEEKEEEINKLVRKSVTPSSCDSCVMYAQVNKVDGLTKNKFTDVYLEENVNDDGDDGTIVVDHEARNVEDINCNYNYIVRRVCSLESFEGKYVIRRNVDLGWYRYQDIAALSGSVVKLWDGERW
ncbi:hypothetical protein AQUCO_07600031v1 [Aquilegia coerulea]|uniref:Uncharacterized protein n=1 Tax=Aquilegia coerulea TaxID=218851 RepID=A0A2G5C8G7_AQUCA|nr:hypothetical protein AQUCO_07600031v1 [Aquilegia coerulea]